MKELFAGAAIAFSLLLLFGCVTPQERAVQETTADSGIGDREIEVGEEPNDSAIYPQGDIIEPPEGPEQPEPAGELSVSDIDVFEESDFDIMMTEDIIEP